MNAAVKPTYLIFADGSAEFEKTLRYAALTAKAHDAKIAILYVLSAQDFQHWANVAERMKEDQLAEAKSLLTGIKQKIHDLGGGEVATYIKEGKKSDAVLEMLADDPTIAKFILTSSVKQMGQGPLFEYFTGKGAHELSVPLTIVPGHLSDERINQLVYKDV